MNDCLAETGANIWILVLVGVGVIIASGVLLLHKRQKSNHSVQTMMVTLGVGLLSILGGGHTYAASGTDCTSAANPPVTADSSTSTSNGNSASSLALTSQPDTSAAAFGVPQEQNVLNNDSPTYGARFVGSSLRLSLPADAPAGSRVTTDKDGGILQSVYIVGEGYYSIDASNPGVIYFDGWVGGNIILPDGTAGPYMPAFVGSARYGVVYTVSDSIGNTTTNTYKPKVTSIRCLLGDYASSPIWPKAYRITDNPPQFNNGDVFILSVDTNHAITDNQGVPSSVDTRYLVDLVPETRDIRDWTTKNSAYGWSMTYDPLTKNITLSVKDAVAFNNYLSELSSLGGSGEIGSYTFMGTAGCDPTAPASITIYRVGSSS